MATLLQFTPVRQRTKEIVLIEINDDLLDNFECPAQGKEWTEAKK